MTWWPMALAAPRWCPGDAGLCAYCGKPEPEHPKPDRLCTNYDAAAHYREMGKALLPKSDAARTIRRDGR